ncbi:MAG: hypothetical protein IJP63_08665 [Acholeplasmatales bacterium]|nr:hypothetical protein [Acholeplasmatales bacterium]
MKIIDTIENLNLQLDDPNCQELSKKLKKKYSILGNLFFYIGLIISISSLIVIITISVYAIVEKKIIYWHMFLIIGMLIFAIMAIIGKIFQSLAKSIIIKK